MEATLDKDLTILEEAARLLGCNPKLVRFLVRKKRIPFRRFGPAKAFDRAGMRRLRRAHAEFLRQPAGTRWAWARSAD